MSNRPPLILRAGPRLVTIAAGAVERIDSFSRDPERVLEAGGILIGSYRGPHIEVTECSQPLPRDRRSRTLFERSDPGHQAVAIRRWKESGRISTFVGEWHTHPESLPTPSYIDINTWSEVSRKNVAGSTIFLIKGYDGWWAGLATGKRLSKLEVLLDRS